MSEQLTDSERVLSRARSLMTNGGAKSWSHAMELASDSVKRDPPTYVLPDFPSREAIEGAGELDFTPRPPTSLAVTVHAILDGFQITVDTTMDQVRSATRKLHELGAQAIISPRR